MEREGTRKEPQERDKGQEKEQGKEKDSIQKGTLGKGFHTERNPRKGKGKGKGKDSIQKGTLRKEKGREGERERIPYRKEP